MLLFCIAFGLSMDYEVFLISRIREFWLVSEQTRADNDESVALGLAQTGRVVTAAALVMSISFAALIAAQVSFMRKFGVGLTLAVLVDATLVRMVFVPAFMQCSAGGIGGRPGRWSGCTIASGSATRSCHANADFSTGIAANRGFIDAGFLRHRCSPTPLTMPRAADTPPTPAPTTRIRRGRTDSGLGSSTSLANALLPGPLTPTTAQVLRAASDREGGPGMASSPLPRISRHRSSARPG